MKPMRITEEEREQLKKHLLKKGLIDPEVVGKQTEISGDIYSAADALSQIANAYNYSRSGNKHDSSWFENQKTRGERRLQRTDNEARRAQGLAKDALTAGYAEEEMEQKRKGWKRSNMISEALKDPNSGFTQAYEKIARKMYPGESFEYTDPETGETERFTGDMFKVLVEHGRGGNELLDLLRFQLASEMQGRGMAVRERGLELQEKNSELRNKLAGMELDLKERDLDRREKESERERERKSRAMTVPGYRSTGVVYPTQSEAQQARRAATQLGEVKAKLERLRDLVNRYGQFEVVDQDAKGRMESLSTDLHFIVKSKDFGDLGVLTGGDLGMLFNKIPPTGFTIRGAANDTMEALGLGHAGKAALDETTKNAIEKIDRAMRGLGYEPVSGASGSWNTGSGQQGRGQKESRKGPPRKSWRDY